MLMRAGRARGRLHSGLLGDRRRRCTGLQGFLLRLYPRALRLRQMLPDRNSGLLSERVAGVALGVASLPRALTRCALHERTTEQTNGGI